MSAPFDPVTSRESVFRQRVQDVLGVMAQQYPSMCVQADLWRPMVVSTTDQYSDEDDEVWVRLNENVPCFMFEKPIRWYQADVGVINQRERWMILPQGLGLRPDDHAIVLGQAFLVLEATEQMGVAMVKLDQTKNRFNKPGRFAATYRLVTIKAAIQ